MKNRVRLAIATGAAVAASCVTATMASAAPLPETPAETTSVQQIQASPGYVQFNAYGEHLWACDTLADGRWVKAQLKWGSKTASVTDTNGSKTGCGHKNLSIKDGTVVYLRIGVEGQGYSAWRALRA
ncbi:hypothetical protein [Kribbella sp. DT2]|uniref:hypothetical protein n=1 Tax=Kribbella sp. DT2 TaxID=3393427 RepID=UPI003CE7D17D